MLLFVYLYYGDTNFECQAEHKYFTNLLSYNVNYNIGFFEMQTLPYSGPQNLLTQQH